MITVAPQVNQANKSLKLDLENLTDDQKALEIKDLDLYYGEKQALSKVNMNIPKGQVTAFRAIGRRKTFGVHMVGGPKIKSEKKKICANSQKRTGLKMN